MTTDERLYAAAITLQKQDIIIQTFIEVLRPFADAANAQMHTDCGGHIKQEDWEHVTSMVAAADRDRANEQMREAQANHAH